MLRLDCARVSLCSSALFVVASAAAFADDILVPRDHRTVEDALDAAVPGDRVIVRGGTFDNIQVKKGNVEVIARGTIVKGYVWIDASSVTVSGLRLGANGRIVITGDDVTVSGVKAPGRGRRVISVQGGRNATIRGNKMATGDIEVLRGADALIDGNRLKTGSIITLGAGATIDSNAVPSIDASGIDASVLGNRCENLYVTGDLCDVANNDISSTMSINGSAAIVQSNEVTGWLNVTGDDASVGDNSLVTGGIFVSGDRATVVSNTVDASPLGVGVIGNDFTITSNDVTAVVSPSHDGSVSGFPMCPGIAVGGHPTEGTITDNLVTHRTGVGITATGDGLTISGNDVNGVASSTSITIVGDGNTVADNTIDQTSVGRANGDGIDIVGDGNTVSGNDIGVVSQDAILVMRGDGNVIADNTIDAAPGCGLVVTCRASDTVISDCIVNGCGLGVVNDGTSTSLTGSTSEANDFADILDLSNGFATFEGNTYVTLSHDQLLAPPAATVAIMGVD
jgi:hypothetical protein